MTAVNKQGYCPHAQKACGTYGQRVLLHSLVITLGWKFYIQGFQTPLSKDKRFAQEPIDNEWLCSLGYAT